MSINRLLHKRKVCHYLTDFINLLCFKHGNVYLYMHIISNNKTNWDKSNRLQLLLGEKNMHPNISIRGAKFIDEMHGNDIRKKHVFTYFVSFEALRRSIEYLEKCEQVLRRYFNGQISEKDTALINCGKYNDELMAKTTFLKVVVDANYVESFALEQATEKIKEQSIITILLSWMARHLIRTCKMVTVGFG